MKNITKLDSNQVIRKAYNEENESLDVSLTNLEMSLELNADDGDSVMISKKSKLFKSEGPVSEFIIDIEMLEKVQIYSTGDFNLEISPDGETYFSMLASRQFEVLGKKLRITPLSAEQIIVVGK